MLLASDNPLDGLDQLLTILKFQPDLLSGVPTAEIFGVLGPPLRQPRNPDVITLCLRCVKRLTLEDALAETVVTSFQAHKSIIESNPMDRCRILQLFSRICAQRRDLPGLIVRQFGASFLFMEFQSLPDRKKMITLTIIYQYAQLSPGLDLSPFFDALFNLIFATDQHLRALAVALLPSALKPAAVGPEDPRVAHGLLKLLRSAQDVSEIQGLLVAIRCHSAHFNHKSLYFTGLFECFEIFWGLCSQNWRLQLSLADVCVSVFPRPCHPILTHRLYWNPIREEHLVGFAQTCFSRILPMIMDPASDPLFVQGIVPCLAVFAEHFVGSLGSSVISRLSQISADPALAPAVATIVLSSTVDQTACHELVRVLLAAPGLPADLEQDLQNLGSNRSFSQIIQTLRQLHPGQAPESGTLEKLCFLIKPDTVIPSADAEFLRDFLLDLVIASEEHSLGPAFDPFAMIDIRVGAGASQRSFRFRGLMSPICLLHSVVDTPDFADIFDRLVAAHPEISSVIVPPDRGHIQSWIDSFSWNKLGQWSWVFDDPVVLHCRVKFQDSVLRHSGQLVRELLLRIPALDLLYDATWTLAIERDCSDMQPSPIRRPTIPDNRLAVVFNLLQILHANGPHLLMDNAGFRRFVRREFRNLAAICGMQSLITWLAVSHPFLFTFSERHFLLQTLGGQYKRLPEFGRAEPRKRPRNHVNVERDKIFEQGKLIIRKLSPAGIRFMVDFPAENSFGTGPTQEFFTILSTEFCRVSRGLWRNDNPGGHFASLWLGLFPSATADESLLFDLGILCATALRYDYTLNLPLNLAFFKLVCNKPVALAEVEPDYTGNLEDPGGLIGLQFIDPQTDLELKPGGADINVTEENVAEFCDLLITFTCGRFIKDTKIAAWTSGFAQVIDPMLLEMFSPFELATMLSGQDAELTSEYLRVHTMITGFEQRPDVLDSFFEIVAEMTSYQRSLLLKFITGSPKLPVGGIAGIEIVPRGADIEALQSASTCNKALKLPPYPSKDVIRKKLLTAIHEGNDYFGFS
jgi:hypothetical protein